MSSTTLINSLDSIRRKVKFLGVAYGVGIALAVAVAGLVVAVLLDYLLNLPPVPRLIVSLLAMGALAHVLWWHVAKPAMHRLSISDIAGRLENAFPQFDDRLRSTVNFIEGHTPGSDAMQERVVSQASSIASQIDLNGAIAPAPAWYSMGMGLGAIALLLLINAFLISPAYRSIALERLFNPFADHPWPKRVQIDLLDALPARLPVGQRLDVHMKLSKGDRASMKAVVFYQYDDGPVMQEFMTRAADGSYAASLDTRVSSDTGTTSMKVWMRAGDDERQAGAVTIVPRLSIKSVDAKIIPPPYVARGEAAATTVNLTAAPAIMAVGSNVALQVRFNKPLADAQQLQLLPVEQDGKLPPVKWTLDQTRSIATGTWTASESLRFHVLAADTDGFNNSALEEFEMIVRPDQLPSVLIENPRRSEDRTSVAVIPLQAVAEDDYGIETLKLMIDRLGDKKHWEIPLVDQSKPIAGVGWNRAEASSDRQRYRMNFDWDLAKLDTLKAGDVLEYHLLVTDNFNLNGQTHEPVASGKLRLNIISQDDLANRVIDELRRTKEQIESTRNAEARAKTEAGNLQTDTKDKKQLDAADKSAAERLTNQQANAAAQTMAISTRLAAIQQKLDENKSPAKELKDLARDVKSDLDRAADGPMKEAAKELSNSSQPNQSPQSRDANFKNAQDKQSEAIAQLEQAMDRMSDIGSVSQTIEKIAQILAEQKEATKNTAQAGRGQLGKRPEEMKPDDRQKLDDAADQQSKLADRTAKALADMQKLVEQMKQSDPSASQSMQKAAQTAQQQNVTKSQQQAAQNTKENQQAQAQSAQKQAELGLEMMLGELREAERSRLAELSKKLEDLQKQIGNLIRRQAGHNLDDLLLQGADVIVKMNADDRANLLYDSQRDPATTQPSAPAPKLPQLSQSQEQTERNTRDIAKTAEAVPEGAEPASHLTRAAGKMERAIFSLQDSKLADAYDPNQVEALAALKAAKQVIDQQKDKVDQQIAENDRDTVRAMYTKIKEEQEKLNADTAAIEKSRDPANNNDPPRREAMRLGQLPGEQGKLADRISDIDKDLARFGSVVYLWANKDIASAMNSVKSDLAKPQTDAAVQDQQKRIVEELDAMIRNLAIKPRESKFAQDNTGGGSGNGKGAGKLPTEAELRLMKDIQIVLNDDTKSIDDAAKKGVAKNHERLQLLGSRQRDLRGLLDTLIQKASNGEMKLGPEPDKMAQLPEEAKEEDIDNQELQDDLLHDKPAADADEQKTMRVGDRMARVRQRLALNDDPGRVTQLIQKRITLDLDQLIEEARQQQAQTRNSDPKNGGQKMDQSAKQDAQANNQGQPNQGKPGQVSKANTPNGTDTKPRASGPTDLSQQVRETQGEWGGISPRIRDAVLQGADDQVLEEYRKLVEDYWRALSDKSKEK